MNPKETLSGAYTPGTLTLPDGTVQEVLVRRVPKADGTFTNIVIDEEALAFEQRFAGTETRPADFDNRVTSVLTKTTEDASTRFRLISADMLAFLGDPDRILAQKGLDTDRLTHLKAHPSSATLARRICINMGGKWKAVAQFIPQFMVDR